jgi:hypothetical protein
MLWATGLGDFELTTPIGAPHPNAPLAVAVAELLESSDYKGWTELRNALTHRGSPPRLHRASIGGPRPSRPTDWGELPLHDRTTEVRRAWLAETLGGLLSAAEVFAQEHLRREHASAREPRAFRDDVSR